MTDETQNKFEGWALVEIFGHQRYAGYVTTEQVGQAAMFRVDVPPLPELERVTKTWEHIGATTVPPGSTVKDPALAGYTKYFGVGAIYAITPCDQAAAEKAVKAMRPREPQLVKLGEERALAAVHDDVVDNEDQDVDPEFDVRL